MFTKRKLTGADFAALSEKPVATFNTLQLMLGGAGNDCVLQCFAWYCQQTASYVGSGVQTQYWDSMLEQNFGYSVDDSSSPCGSGYGVCASNISLLATFGGISAQLHSGNGNITLASGQKMMLTYTTASGQQHAVIYTHISGGEIHFYDPQNNISSFRSKQSFDSIHILSY
jgi:hypothetical protein